MPIRKLLLPLTGEAGAAAALKTALQIARLWDAHLLVMHVRVDGRDVAPLAGEGLSGGMVEGMMAAAEAEGVTHARTARALFDAAMAEAGIAPGEPRDSRHPSASFAAVAGRAGELVAQHARLADLTVVPQPGNAADPSLSETLDALFFDSGRPVLIAPPTAPAQLGRRICLAWNGTAESAAAVAAALPWLARAEAVRILTVEPDQCRGPAASDLVDYLAMHDVSADVVTIKPIERDLGAGLLRAAEAFNSDLLARGAYSHSRLRQLFVGGTTRHVLEHATLPVLMNR
jgi:nucleotide-binding universal stress UspA family protein